VDGNEFESSNENSAVTCPSADECLAVDGLGTDDPVALHIPLGGSDPATVEQLPFVPASGADTARMNGISCASATYCVAIGEQYHAGSGDEEDPSDFSWFYDVDDNGTWTTHEIPMITEDDPHSHAAIEADAVDCASTGTCYIVGHLGSDDAPPPVAWPDSATITRVSTSGASTVVPAVPDRYLGESRLNSIDCAAGPVCQTYGGSSDVVRGHGVGESFTTRLGAPQRPMYVNFPKFSHGQLLQTAMACRSADDCVIAGTVHIADGSDHGQGRNGLYLLHN
ncbi:MAG TPA: hypothetical protein VGH30_01670, partial [Jatrophihabitantaceae bacterium]